MPLIMSFPRSRRARIVVPRPRRLGAFVAAAASLALAAAAPAEGPAVLDVDHGAPHTLRIDRGALAAQLAAAPDGRVRIDLPLPDGRHVDLDLERFRVTSPETRFVAGADGTPIAFDPDAVVLLRGTVAGAVGSRVYLGVSPHGTVGSAELGTAAAKGPARLTFGPARTADGGVDAGRVVVDPAPRGGFLPPSVAACSMRDRHDKPAAPAPPARTVAGGPAELQGPGGGGAPAPPQVRMIELAVETDFEYFSLFDGDTAAAFSYIVQVYGGVTAIFLPDVDGVFLLSFVRLWTTPDDLFNCPNPLGAFRLHWNETMQDVVRDVAQFFSGRRDVGYGGIAYLDSICSDFGYSVVAYANGMTPGDLGPSVFHYDAGVAAHELGHNCASSHTHTYGLDSCNDFFAVPQRGTIMSYCGQTVSGAHANVDHRFHLFVRDVIREALAGYDCLHTDCNTNGVPDDADIAFGTSLDVNGNGVPDECEDCNGNGVLDTDDILDGTSHDADGNGLPDECQPDCNENGSPDRRDIDQRISVDANGNGVPDECELDSDGDGRIDYLEIQLDMGLDVDRNIVLDALEDCDDDGTTDLDALLGAHAVWGASTTQAELRFFHPITGVLMNDPVAAPVDQANDLIVAGSGRVLVSSGVDDRVVEFDRGGALVRDFVTSGSGGLDDPAAMTLGPGGNLFVASRGTDSVLEYDGRTGAFVGVFVEAGAGGLTAPFGLAFGPDDNLYVTSATNEVLVYDGRTGAFGGVFVAKVQIGLEDPRGIAFLPNGHLLAASYLTRQILEYDETGAFIRQFNQGGTETALTLNGPWCIRIGPDGLVYVSRHDVEAEVEGDFLRDPLLHLNASRIYIFDPDLGYFLRSYVTGNDTGWYNPSGFDFLPDEEGVDCNLNARPDACDIANGTSVDVNDNGIPDECEGTCPFDIDGDGLIGISDLLNVLSTWGPCAGCPADLDGDDVVGFGDLLAVLGAWGACG